MLENGIVNRLMSENVTGVLIGNLGWLGKLSNWYTGCV